MGALPPAPRSHRGATTSSAGGTCSASAWARSRWRCARARRCCDGRSCCCGACSRRRCHGWRRWSASCWALEAYGIEEGIGAAALVFLASNLVGLFPIIPGNLVVFQGATYTALQVYNIPANAGHHLLDRPAADRGHAGRRPRASSSSATRACRWASCAPRRRRPTGSASRRRARGRSPRSRRRPARPPPRPRAEPMPPAAISSPGTCGRSRASSAVSGPSWVPSRSIAVTRKSRTPASASERTNASAADAGVLPPARRPHRAVAHVGRDGDARRVARQPPDQLPADAAASVPTSTRATPSSSASRSARSSRMPPPTCTAMPDRSTSCVDHARRAPAGGRRRGRRRGRPRAAASRPARRSAAAASAGSTANSVTWS